jgi:hypothetical protein
MNKNRALDPPKGLNPNAIEIWFKVCASDYRLATKDLLKEYVEACNRAGLYPFVEPSHDSNVAIRNYLYKRRRKFVRFLDFTKLMVGLPIIRLIKRNAFTLPNGFGITISCQLRIEDPTWVRKLAHLGGGYRFPLMRDRFRRYVLDLDPGICVFVYNDMINAPNLWHIGYTIICPIVPDYEGMEHYKHDYVLQHLWAPLFHAYRGKGLNRIRYI